MAFSKHRDDPKKKRKVTVMTLKVSNPNPTPVGATGKTTIKKPAGPRLGVTNNPRRRGK